MKILITNGNTACHYEILESVIKKMYENGKNMVDVYYVDTHQMKYTEYFNKYIINDKIKRVQSYDVKEYDLIVFTTKYSRDVNEIRRLNDIKGVKCVFFSHQVSQQLLQFPNVFYLTPLCGNKNYMYMDMLPFMSEYKKPDKMNILVQGLLERRDVGMLKRIIDVKGDFKVTLLGKTMKPQWLYPYINSKKVIMKSYLNFVEYHREILKCSHIITLTSPSIFKEYYTGRLTSTINYARAYGKNGMVCLIDEGLQKIYQLENAIVYDEKNVEYKIKDEIDKW